jgi:hypothetical protein
MAIRDRDAPYIASITLLLSVTSASVTQRMQVTAPSAMRPCGRPARAPCAAYAAGSLTVITCECQCGSCVGSSVMGLGTTWGPHAPHEGRRPARRLVARTALAPPRTRTDAYSYVLAVKGSQVRILSSRPSSVGVSVIMAPP